MYYDYYHKPSVGSLFKQFLVMVFVGYVSPDDTFIRHAASQKPQRTSALGLRNYRAES